MQTGAAYVWNMLYIEGVGMQGKSGENFGGQRSTEDQAPHDKQALMTEEVNDRNRGLGGARRLGRGSGSSAGTDAGWEEEWVGVSGLISSRGMNAEAKLMAIPRT